MVLAACPDIADYAKGGISNWRDFLCVAAILQRGAAITSAGGYLRELTRKAEVGEFTLGPMLMALIGSRKRDKKRA